jgi:hypothetical protein
VSLELAHSYAYYAEGPFTCDGCGRVILRGEPHSQNRKKGHPCHRCFECAGVTNVGWWPCSQCGIAHGELCPPPDAALPPWPPAGWSYPETGRRPADRRQEVAEQLARIEALR